MEEILSKQSDTFNDVIDKLLRKDDQRQIYISSKGSFNYHYGNIVRILNFQKTDFN